jgi:predicted metal-dependent hydrolase
MPKYFAADQDLILSHLGAVLSSVFPDGEEFFVSSVRHYRDEITDPELRRQVNGFIGQESTHGRVHRSFNARLAELGYRTEAAERRVKFVMKVRRKLMTAEKQLAMTAALEHFTATLAELVMRDERAREMFGDSAAHDIFVWHALEESEHKAVAFDVFRATGGSEKIRVRAMRSFRPGFVVGMAVQVAIALVLDPAAWRRGALRQSIWRFRRSPLWSRAVWDQLCDFDRPDFHPDDHDTSDLVAEWRERLFGDHGELNRNLAAAAA